MNPHLIRIENLHFKTSTGEQLFNGLNLAIKRGSITAILGASGSGKTSLLKMILGLFQPEAGEILIAGERVDRLKGSALQRIRKRMSMLFQSGALFTDYTLFENVAFPIRAHRKLPEELLRMVVLMKLESVGLRGAQDLFPAQLSGGMIKRGAFARALALDPELVLFDEPFVGQDPVTVNFLAEIVKKTNQLMGTTYLIVSHDLPELLAIADYAYLIDKGKVLIHGTPSTLVQSNHPKVEQFMHGGMQGPLSFHYPASPYEEALFCA